MIRLALRVRGADAELVLADLLELAPGGVEEIELLARDGGEALVEYAVYGAPGELPELPDLQAAAGRALVEVSTSEVADDWSERWKRFHRPVLVEAPLDDLGADAAPNTHARHSLFVRPPWEAPSDRADALEIVIDPGQAFGTGAHATTGLCLELLLGLAESDDARGPVLDVGAGSGVLAIAAAKLGYGPVVALDNDRESVRAIVANATVNRVQVEGRRFDLRAEALPWPARQFDPYAEVSPGPASNRDEAAMPMALDAPAGSGRGGAEAVHTIVLANLVRPLLLEMADMMTAPPRHLIASGLLREQADEAAQAFAKRLGLRERARRERGEWAALWLAPARSPHAPSP